MSDSTNTSSVKLIEDFTGWLFVDLLDLRVEKDLFLSPDGKPRPIERWLEFFPGCMIKGSRQPLRGGDWRDVRYLTVTYSKVTSTILDRTPNVKWVIARGHSYGNIDMEECKRRGIGVASVGGFLSNCAAYIKKHIQDPPYVFYGWGRIPRLAAKELRGVRYINTRTEKDFIGAYLKEAGTLIASVPIPIDKRPVFTDGLFSLCSGCHFVSICHEPLMSNRALISAIERGNVNSAVVDSLQKDSDRDKLLSTGKVVWTKDTAWSTGFNYDEYQAMMKRSLSEIIEGNHDGILLKPGKPVSTGFF